MITSKEIKSIKALSSKKFRDETGLFVVEGEKMVAEAQKSSFEIVKLYRTTEIGEEAMSRMSQLSSPSPVLALVRKPSTVDDGNFIASRGLYLALDSIRDPGNLGTIIRIADWFGIKSVLATRDTVEVFNPKVIQATMGAIFRVDFKYVDLENAAKAILESGGKVYGTFLDGNNICSQDLATGENCACMIVIGNESNGISEAMSHLVSDRLFIPPYPMDDAGSESLNAAMATAISVYEFRRRCFIKE